MGDEFYGHVTEEMRKAGAEILYENGLDLGLDHREIAERVFERMWEMRHHREGNLYAVLPCGYLR